MIISGKNLIIEVNKKDPSLEEPTELIFDTTPIKHRPNKTKTQKKE